MEELYGDSIAVARSGDAVYLRILGRGCARVAPMFEEFSAEMAERGYRWFVIDLGTCTGMDSTFMGVIVGLFVYLRDRGHSGVSVINADAHNRILLDELGLSRIVSVVQEAVEIPGVEMEALPPMIVGDEERLSVVRRAHEHLVRIDKRNEDRFGPFLSSLTAEMKQKNLG